MCEDNERDEKNNKKSLVDTGITPVAVFINPLRTAVPFWGQLLLI